MKYIYYKICELWKHSYCIVGTKILCGIHAIDKDKPSTLNSDVYYTITDGNEEKKFTLENGDNGTCITLSKNLDYDKGERQFIITVAAMVSAERTSILRCPFKNCFFICVRTNGNKFELIRNIFQSCLL